MRKGWHDVCTLHGCMTHASKHVCMYIYVPCFYNFMDRYNGGSEALKFMALIDRHVADAIHLATKVGRWQCMRASESTDPMLKSA